MSRFWRGAGLGLFLVAAVPCWADLPATTAPSDSNAVLYPHADATHATPGSPAGWSGGMISFFVVVLGAAGGWMLWQRNRGAGAARFGRGTGGGQGLQIAETRSLGNRQFLIVANYGDRKFLLGVCPGRIDLLAPLDGATPSAPAVERP